MYYNTWIDNSLFEFTKRPRPSKPDAHSHLLVWTYSQRRVGLYATWAFLWVSQRQNHQTDLNSNNKKNYRVTPTIESLRTKQIASGSQRLVGFSGGAETRYKKYPCKGSCKRKSYETICENIVSRYQTFVSSLPRMTAFRHRRPKTEFTTGPHRQPSNYKKNKEYWKQMYTWKLKTVKSFFLYYSITRIKRFIFPENFTFSSKQSLTQTDSD